MTCYQKICRHVKKMKELRYAMTSIKATFWKTKGYKVKWKFLDNTLASMTQKWDWIATYQQNFPLFIKDVILVCKWFIKQYSYNECNIWCIVDVDLCSVTIGFYDIFIDSYLHINQMVFFFEVLLSYIVPFHFDNIYNCKNMGTTWKK